MPRQSAAAFRREEAIVRAQSRRVRSAVRHAYRSVPYYSETMRARGLDPSDLRCAADLSKLPLLDRDQVQRDPEYFLSTAQPRARCREVHSSGSTGAPLTAYWDWPAHFRSVAYTRRGGPPGFGAWVGRRTTVIATPTGSVRAGQSFNQQMAIVPVRRQNLSLADSPARNVELINQFRPHLLLSYGSYLEDLFMYLERSGAQMHSLKAVMYGADSLSATAQRLITERWKIHLCGVYQSVEVANIAFDCGRGSGLHLNTDLCPLRIVDRAGLPCAAGEPGEVVVSNLVNRATVLLNYRPGDLASIRPERCECGRTLPLLSYVEGRNDDWIERASGTRLHPQTVCQAFRGEGDVWQFQVMQPARGRLSAAIVLAPRADESSVGARLQLRLRELIGEDTAVDIRFVDMIAPGPTGKRRAVVSHLAEDTDTGTPE